MIERTTHESRLSVAVTSGKHDHSTTELLVALDSADKDRTVFLQLRRWSPLFDVTAFLTVEQARELAEALTAVVEFSEANPAPPATAPAAEPVGEVFI